VHLTRLRRKTRAQLNASRKSFWEIRWSYTISIALSVSPRQTIECKEDRGAMLESVDVCHNLIRNRPQVVDSTSGQMLERSIRHAWKAILANDTKRCRNTSWSKRFNDLAP
jgi:hypothetical protein